MMVADSPLKIPRHFINKMPFISHVSRQKEASYIGDCSFFRLTAEIIKLPELVGNPFVLLTVLVFPANSFADENFAKGVLKCALYLFILSYSLFVFLMFSQPHPVFPDHIELQSILSSQTINLLSFRWKTQVEWLRMQLCREHLVGWSEGISLSTSRFIFMPNQIYFGGDGRINTAFLCHQSHVSQ